MMSRAGTVVSRAKASTTTSRFLRGVILPMKRIVASGPSPRRSIREAAPRVEELPCIDGIRHDESTQPARRARAVAALRLRHREHESRVTQHAVGPAQLLQHALRASGARRWSGATGEITHGTPAFDSARARKGCPARYDRRGGAPHRTTPHARRDTRSDQWARTPATRNAARLTGSERCATDAVNHTGRAVHDARDPSLAPSVASHRTSVEHSVTWCPRVASPW